MPSLKDSSIFVYLLQAFLVFTFLESLGMPFQLTTKVFLGLMIWSIYFLIGYSQGLLSEWGTPDYKKLLKELNQ